MIFQTPTTTNQPPQLSLPLWATNILTQHKKERKKEKEREEKERESGWLQEKESGEFIFLSPLGEEFLGEGEKEGEREGGNGVVLEVEVCGTDLEKCFSSSQLGVPLSLSLFFFLLFIYLFIYFFIFLFFYFFIFLFIYLFIYP